MRFLSSLGRHGQRMRGFQRGSALDALAGAAGNAVQRPINYSSNWLLPNVLVDADTIIQLHHAGWITREAATDALYYHGISLTERAGVTSPAAAHWRAAFDQARTKPGISDVLDLYMRDRIDEKEALARLHELGMSNRRERELLVTSGLILAEGDVLDFWARDEFRAAEADSRLRQLGYLDGDIRRLLLQRKAPLNLGDILTLNMRGQLDNAETHEHIGRLGIRDTGERELLRSLTSVIPGVADLVRFVIKDAFDQQLVNELGLDDEYDQQRERYEFWCARQGLGRMTLPGNPDNAEVNWPQMYYRSAWQIISPTQAYAALQRLRPTGGPGGGPRNPNGVVFTRDNMLQVLKAADYPQKQRDWLIETSFLPLTRTDLRRMYDLGVLGGRAPDQPIVPGDPVSEARATPAGRELHEGFQDNGYNAVDAARLALFTIAEERTRRSKLILGNARAAIMDAYRVGVVDADEASIRLYRLRLDDPIRRAEFDNQPRDRQTAIAVADPSVRSGLVAADLQADLGLAKEHIRAIRKGYLGGVIGRDGADGRLQRLGIVRPKIERYLELWDSQRTAARKTLTASRIQHMLRYGIIGPGLAEMRLANLGFGVNDVQLILSDAQRERGIDMARQLERAATTERARLRAIQQQIREAERARRAAEKRLTALGTPAKLARWVVRGLIAPEAMRLRLIASGVAPADADVATADAVAEREAYRARQRQRQRQSQN
jgi:hypothetical protein